MIKDYLKLHLVVLVLGLTAVLGKLVDMPTIALVFYRCLLASIGLGLLLFLSSKKKEIPTKKLLFKMVFVGLILAAHWLCFFGSAKMSTASVSLVAFSTTSFFTSLIEPIFYKRRINLLELAIGLVVVLALIVLFNVESTHALALLVGLLGAFLASLYSVLNGTLAPHAQKEWITFVELLSAAAFLIPLLFFVPFGSSSARDWLWIGVLAFVCTLWPYLTILDLLKRMTPFSVNLSVNMEPIYGVLLAVFIFGEKEYMSPGFYFAAMLILSTIILHAWAKKNSQKGV